MELFDGNPAKSVFEPLDVSVVMRGRCENLWQCQGATRLGSTLRRGRRSMGGYSHPAVVQVTSVHQQAQVKAPCTHDRREADPDGFTLREALVRQRRNVAGQVPRSRSGDALRHGPARRSGKERLVSERSLDLAGASYRAQVEKFRSSFNVWFYGDTVLGSCMRMPYCVLIVPAVRHQSLCMQLSTCTIVPM